MKIGVIGSGNIGGTVGRLWVEAGHHVMFAARHLDQLHAMVKKLGERASVGQPGDAARYGEVVFISVPYKALAEVGQEVGRALRGKIVLETGNPYPERDGKMAEEVRNSGRGTGPYSAGWLPGARLVRAFNSVNFKVLQSEAHRKGDRVGVPLASDDDEAMEVAAQLVRDAGFDPVIVGPLDRAREFDVGTAVYNTGMSGVDLRRALGLSANA